MSLKLIILTEEAFKTINEKLEYIEELVKVKSEEKKSFWLDNQEFMEFLKISRRIA